jgi:hypothetical protein
LNRGAHPADKKTRDRDDRAKEIEFVTLGLDGIHVDEATMLALILKADFAIDERENRVVFADAYVHAWVKVRAALTDDDAASSEGLTAEDLHAKALGVRVAAVTGGAYAFFMSHGSPLLKP